MYIFDDVLCCYICKVLFDRIIVLKDLINVIVDDY